MNETWVLDASPVIIFAKAKLDELLRELPKACVIPTAVVREIDAGPANDPGRVLLQSGFASIIDVDQVQDEIREWGLGAGESAVLTLAAQLPHSVAVIDDADGRRCAASLGIRQISTVSIIIEAKAAKRIDSLKTALDSLRQAGFWLSETLYQQLCEHDEA